MEMHLLLFGSFGSKSKSKYFKIFLEMHDIGLSKLSKYVLRGETFMKY